MKLFQKLYFLYDRSNIIKRTFINEIKKFLPLYCSGSFYGEMEKEKDIIENHARKKELDLQSRKGKWKENRNNRK